MDGSSGKKSKVRNELYIMLASGIMVLVLEIISVVVYSQHWSDIFRSFHILVLVTIMLYAISVLLRLFWAGIKILFKLNKKSF